MQHIQDKDLDKLFRTAFEDVEIEPSANLWSGIEKAIVPKKKRKFPILWLSAASIAVIFTFMLFNKEEKMQMHGRVKPEIKEFSEPIVNQATAPEELPDQVALVNTTEKLAFTETKQPEILKDKTKVVEVNNSTIPENYVAQVEQVKEPVKQQIVAETLSEPIVYAQATTAPIYAVNADDKDQNDRKGIRNIGDIINFVVDKVDKRDRKAIKFDTRDDESSIVGINIGFLKFNKRNNNTQDKN